MADWEMMPAVPVRGERVDDRAWYRFAREKLGGAESVHLDVDGHDVRVSQSPGGELLRLEVDDVVQMAHNDFSRSSGQVLHTPASVLSGAAERPGFWKRLLAPRPREVECPLELDPRTKLSIDQSQLCVQLIQQAWTAWRAHGGSVVLRDGDVFLRAAGTADGKSFQAELHGPGSTGITMNLNVWDDKLDWHVGDERNGIGATVSLGHAAGPGQEEPFQQLLVDSLQHGDPSVAATRVLRTAAGGLAPGETLAQAVSVALSVGPVPFILSAGLVARGVSRATAAQVYQLDPARFEEVSREMTGQRSAEEYLGDPLRWKAARLGEKLKPAPAGVVEDRDSIQVGGVQLRKRA